MEVNWQYEWHEEPDRLLSEGYYGLEIEFGDDGKFYASAFSYVAGTMTSPPANKPTMLLLCPETLWRRA